MPLNYWKYYKVELEIDGRVTDSRVILRSEYDALIHEFRFKAHLQNYPWAIFVSKPEGLKYRDTPPKVRGQIIINPFKS